MLFPLFASSLAKAEYRAFWLQIQNTKVGSYRYKVHNLDPLQYPSYYPLSQDEQVTYIDTWMCKGRTSPGIETCPSPRREQILQKLAELQSQQNEKNRQEAARPLK